MKIQINKILLITAIKRYITECESSIKYYQEQVNVGKNEYGRFDVRRYWSSYDIKYYSVLIEYKVDDLEKAKRDLVMLQLDSRDFIKIKTSSRYFSYALDE